MGCEENEESAFGSGAYLAGIREEVGGRTSPHMGNHILSTPRTTNHSLPPTITLSPPHNFSTMDNHILSTPRQPHNLSTTNNHTTTLSPPHKPHQTHTTTPPYTPTQLDKRPRVSPPPPREKRETLPDNHA
nr:mucin-2-like [Penaeus vannamei]